MNITISTYRHRRIDGRFLIVACIALILLAVVAQASEYDGFTEPNRTVNVAAVETGTIKSIEVREGQRVKKGDVLARLDDDVYLALLAIADEAMNARGQLKSAQAELVLRQQRLRKLETLRSDGHARQEEVERAQTDVAVAEARVLSANELLQVKRLEHEKIQVQLARRVILSPIDGVVNLLRKDVGEFVAPNDPHVVELVELDPLLATFSIPSYEAVRLKKGQKVPVFLEDVADFVEGTVDMVAPVTDAESGTVRVKVRIVNSDGRYRCGERCTLQMKGKRSGRSAR
jgi:RND family efflux transporter MFP subunit